MKKINDVWIDQSFTLECELIYWLRGAVHQRYLILVYICRMWVSSTLWFEFLQGLARGDDLKHTMSFFQVQSIHIFFTSDPHRWCLQPTTYIYHWRVAIIQKDLGNKFIKSQDFKLQPGQEICPLNVHFLPVFFPFPASKVSKRMFTPVFLFSLYNFLYI